MNKYLKGGKKAAVALKYKPANDSAPKVIASGRGEIASKIIELAHNNNIPIKSDPLLTELLIKIKIEDEIPPDLYETMAEIFAFLYSLDKTLGKGL